MLEIERKFFPFLVTMVQRIIQIKSFNLIHLIR